MSVWNLLLALASSGLAVYSFSHGHVAIAWYFVAVAVGFALLAAGHRYVDRRW